MDKPTRISVVTPVLGDTAHLLDALSTVEAQRGVHVEHLVVTGLTPPCLDNAPRARLIAAPGGGEADGVNHAFGVAGGDVFAVLRPRERLAPDALSRVARELDPPRGRHVVMGRCRLVDDEGTVTGIEHPSRFEGHRRVLQPWKGQTIPRPAVFWTREAWRQAGGLDDSLTPAGMYYDLLCRLSRHYRFHRVDQVLAECRLDVDHAALPSGTAQALDECIRVSRRYWGSALSPGYWPLALGAARFRLDRVGRARRSMRRAEQSLARGQMVRGAAEIAIGAALAPWMALYVGVFPRVRDGGLRIWRRTRARRAGAERRDAGTPAAGA